MCRYTCIYMCIHMGIDMCTVTADDIRDEISNGELPTAERIFEAIYQDERLQLSMLAIATGLILQDFERQEKVKQAIKKRAEAVDTSATSTAGGLNLPRARSNEM